MERKPNEAEGQSPLPSDALPCVWMSAGLLMYRLCDRNYECEGCPLDQALRGHNAHPARSAPASPPWDFPADRRYHRLHGWIAESGGGRVRYGLDAFAAWLLADATSIVLPGPGSRIEQGRTVSWVVDDAETIPLCSPVSGTVRAVNRCVQEEPHLLGTSPYDRGWLLELDVPALAERVAGLVGADEQRERSTAQLGVLQHQACARAAPDAIVGVTMADGGLRLESLRKVLGTARYHRLILRFLR